MSRYMKFVIGAASVMLVLLGWHFGTVFGLWGAAPETQTEFFIRLGIIVTGFIIISIVSAILVGARSDDDLEPDEREVHIVRKAERNGGYVVMAGLICLMWFVFRPMTPMQIANAALGILSLGELAKIASGLLYLRQGE